MPIEDYKWRTKEQEKACESLAKLSHLIYEYNNGWEPDWGKFLENKYSIVCMFNTLRVYYSDNIQSFLTFKTGDIAEKFLEDFRDLIEIAKPLL